MEQERFKSLQASAKPIDLKFTQYLNNSELKQLQNEIECNIYIIYIVERCKCEICGRVVIESVNRRVLRV